MRIVEHVNPTIPPHNLLPGNKLGFGYKLADIIDISSLDLGSESEIYLEFKLLYPITPKGSLLGIGPFPELQTGLLSLTR